MFANTRAFSGFAVDDIEAAKKFYGETLGLRTSEQYGLLTLHLAGDRDTLVYPKPDHVPASYTILNLASASRRCWPARSRSSARNSIATGSRPSRAARDSWIRTPSRSRRRRGRRPSPPTTC